jgi:hypothetical protein
MPESVNYYTSEKVQWVGYSVFVFILNVVSTHCMTGCPSFSTQLYDWLPIILNSNNAIRDEYLRHITAHEMLETITCRSRDVSPDWTPKEWEMNHAEPGPNNLVRGRIVKEFDPGRTHGEGTWDYCNYEFC